MASAYSTHSSRSGKEMLELNNLTKPRAKARCTCSFTSQGHPAEFNASTATSMDQLNKACNNNPYILWYGLQCHRQPSLTRNLSWL